MRTLALFSGLISASLVAAPKLRTDIDLTGPVCLAKNAAATGLFDAQIEVAIVRALEPGAAEDFAQSNGHRGFGSGRCPDGRLYIFSTPAPQTLIRATRDGLELNLKAKPDNCQTWNVSILRKNALQPENLALSETKISSTKLKSWDALAITCVPSQPRTEGRELWALWQNSNSTPAEAPLEKDFLNWINQKRKTLKLEPLRLNQDRLQAAAEASLAAATDLKHPRSTLLQLRNDLQKSKWELLGENRASAPDFSSAIQKLWQSPEHRSLFLNPKANRIAWSSAPRLNEKLLVLVLARQ